MGMGKMTKTCLLLGAGMCLAGAGVFLCGYAAGGKAYVQKADLNEINGAVEQEEKGADLILEKTKLESFQELHADLENIDVIIKPSNDENFYISYRLQSRKGKNPLTYNVKSGVLELEEKNGHGSYYVHVDIEFLRELLGKGNVEDYRNEVTVYVPEQETLKNCQAELGDGDMIVEGIRCETADLTLDYGDLDLENALFSDGKMTLENGDMTAVNTEFSGMELSLAYGDVLGRESFINKSSIMMGDGDAEFRKTDLRNMDIKLSYGELELKELTMENTTVLLEDGDLDGSDVSFLNRNRIEGGYGDVSIRTAEGELKKMTLSLDTEYGNIEVAKGVEGSLSKKEDMQHYEKVVDGTEDFLEIVVEDGDISLKE